MKYAVEMGSGAMMYTQSNPLSRTTCGRCFRDEQYNSRCSRDHSLIVAPALIWQHRRKDNLVNLSMYVCMYVSVLVGRSGYASRLLRSRHARAKSTLLSVIFLRPSRKMSV
jgi:hypothetical protein